MGKVRLVHDEAFAAATILTEAMQDRLQPGERQAYHRRVYEVVKQAICGYEAKREREEARIGRV